MWLGPQVILCQPAVAPVGEAKPLYDIVKGLARRWGGASTFPYEKWEDWGELMMKNIPMSLEELKQKGILVRAHSLQPGTRRIAHAVGQDSRSIRRPMPMPGFDPYPVYTERSVIPDKDYPLQVTHSKLSMHCNV